MQRGLENLRDFAGRSRRVAVSGSMPGPRESAVPVDPEGRADGPESRGQRPPPFG
jgi:hypothetical protein